MVKLLIMCGENYRSIITIQNINKKAKPMPYFNIVAQTSENTVVTEYEPAKARSECYQSKAELEELNKYNFSDTEWQK